MGNGKEKTINYFETKVFYRRRKGRFGGAAWALLEAQVGRLAG